MSQLGLRFAPSVLRPLTYSAARCIWPDELANTIGANIPLRPVFTGLFVGPINFCLGSGVRWGRQVLVF